MLYSPAGVQGVVARGWWRVERSSGACRSLAAVMDCGLQVHVAEERLEHEQGPDRGAVVTDAAAMLVQQALDEAHVEEVDLLEDAVEQPPAHGLAQGAAEPARQRAAEAHLLAVEDVARQARLHRLLQQVLAQIGRAHV